MTTILLAEKDPALRDLLADILKVELAATVTCASTGTVGAEIIATEFFSLAIIDVHMTGITGYDLAARTTSRNIPALLCTGHPDDIAMLQNCNRPHLAKPFGTRELVYEAAKFITRATEHIRCVRESLAMVQMRVGRIASHRPLETEVSATRTELDHSRPQPGFDLQFPPIPQARRSSSARMRVRRSEQDGVHFPVHRPVTTPAWRVWATRLPTNGSDQCRRTFTATPREIPMPELQRYDALILGSGEGGKYLAWHLARSGKRVAVIERRLIGGACPNTNCLPSKNEIWSAKVADLARHGVKFGTTTGPVVVDMAHVLARKRAMVDALIAMHLENYKASGTELIMGAGRFVAPKVLEVQLNDGGGRRLTADQVFVNVGTHPAIPDVPGLQAAGPLTNVEALELDVLPQHLIVLGGGYVGLELAQAYRRFGSQVTIIEHDSQLAGREDADVADEVQRFLTSEGVDIIVSATPLRVWGRCGEGIGILVATPSGERTVEGSHILVAVGRRPNTDGVGFEVAGVKLDDRGYIAVNERLETTAPGVWAIGECAGSPQFTHVSFDDFRVIRDNLAGGSRSTRNRLVPYCMFTDPPLGRVGLSEAEAQRRNIAVRVARLPIKSVLRTRTIDETTGFMKAMVAADSDRIVGFAMVGPEAGEVVAVIQTAMQAGLPYTVLRDLIIAHPTMAEGLGALFRAVPPPSTSKAAT
jgi:pyruvate/2-oxoglutarate dehydrogenase complex dihydrolipoamide dehydrogenase (E3) component/CheY-like chemotaxis protein